MGTVIFNFQHYTVFLSLDLANRYFYKLDITKAYKSENTNVLKS